MFLLESVRTQDKFVRDHINGHDKYVHQNTNASVKSQIGTHGATSPESESKRVALKCNCSPLDAILI